MDTRCDFTTILIFSVYVDMGLASSSPVVLTAVTSGASFARSFSVKVTQIECNSLVRGKIFDVSQHTFCL